MLWHNTDLRQTCVYNIAQMVNDKEYSTNYDLEIIAGHCSFQPENLAELYDLSEIQVSDAHGNQRRALSAVRFVGAKSRTEKFESVSEMGLDAPIIEQAILTGKNSEPLPSVIFAQKFIQETGMGIASEIIAPHIQLPWYEKMINEKKFMPWNPSCDQLGWTIFQIATYAAKNNWTIGLKNGKWLGATFEEATRQLNPTVTSMENTWMGLATYAQKTGSKIAFIHRGVDIPEKEKYRNIPVHRVVEHLAHSFPKAKRYFDPSHSLGEKLKDCIVDEIINVMKMKTGNDFLYNGLIVETGTSPTDTNQHISIEQTRYALNEVAKFRQLRGPW